MTKEIVTLIWVFGILSIFGIVLIMYLMSYIKDLKKDRERLKEDNDKLNNFIFNISKKIKR